MNNIITRLGVHASARPHATAFAILNNGEEVGQEVTFGQLQSKVAILASYLSAKQLYGKRVLLAYQDIVEFIAAFLACQHCGIIAVPVSYPRGTKQVARLFAIIEDAQASAIMSTADTVALVGGMLPGSIEMITTDNASAGQIVEPTFHETSFIQYTSGSTGRPKGVVVSAKNLWHNQQLIAETFGCKEGSVILSWLPFHHDMGLIGNILHAIYIGCRCIMMSPLSFMQRPSRWLEAISNYKVTHSGGPNFAYDIAVEKMPAEEVSKLDLSSWVVAYNGSEPLRLETLQRFTNYFSAAGFSAGALCPCYGLAEATLLVSGNKRQTPPSAIFIERELREGKAIISTENTEGSIAVVSSGNVAAGMDCRIIAVNSGIECNELQEGEICIAGDSVTAGYWARDNKEHFYNIDDKQFLRTGDLGFMYNGSLFVHGRLKEMLIIRGKNFYPYDIEDATVESNTSIETNGVAAFSVNTPEEGLVVLAEVKRHLIKAIAAEDVIKAIDNAIAASFDITAYDIILTTPLGIPRTTSGKLQRVKCREAYMQNALNVIASKRQLSAVTLKKESSEQLLKEVNNGADHNSVRKYLVNVIESRIGSIASALADDSTALTALGLDSLRAMEVINTVNRDLDINLDASKIFQLNTLSGLIAAIESTLRLKQHQASNREITAITIPAIAKQENYPASNAQKRLWLLSQFEGGSEAYNIVTALLAKGVLNKENFEKAFRLCVQRHESLRTVFAETDGDLRQVILNDAEFNIKYEDISTQENVKEYLRLEIENFARHKFDLGKNLPVRVKVFRLSETAHAIVLGMHHIVSDGWSVTVLLQEVLQLYKQLNENGTAVADTLRIQYKDYSEWLNERVENHNEAKAFWQGQFSNLPEPLNLPYDFARPAVQNFEGAVAKFYIDAALYGRTIEFCNRNNVTLFNFLRTVVSVLLNKFTGESDITIGSPVSGRNHYELEEQIGFYANTLPLRATVTPQDSFASFLKKISENSASAFAFQEYPFDKIVEDVSASRDAGRNPLFDVVMALQNTSIGEGKIDLGKKAGLEIDRIDQHLNDAARIDRENIFSKFDLSFTFGTDPGNKFYLEIEYATKLFKQSSINRFFNAYIYITSQILEQPATQISAVQVVDAQEQERILKQAKESAAAYPTQATITSLFEEQVARTPGNIAVVFAGETLTYTTLNEKANRLADYLRSNYNIQAEDLVGMKLERSLEMIIAIMAILKSGGAYVPIDPAYPQERIDYMIEDSRCKVVIDDEELAKFSAEENNYSSNNLIPVNKASDLAYVIYTSGTTGKPKGSLIEHRNVVRLFKTDKPLFDFTENDVWTMFHSYCFDFSVWEMYGALLFGGRVVVIPLLTAKDPAAYLEVLNREGVTVLNQTPSAFYNLIKEELEKQEATLKLRYVIFGGEALSPGKLAGFNKKYPSTELINMYGITETTVHVTYKKITSVEIENNSSNIGKPIPTLACYVLDQYQQFLPVGVSGELYVGGEGVCRGYLNREELTAKKFIENPFVKGERLYRSGDKATLLENGELEYGGRLDEQVKIRGFRIELGEIEAALQRIDGVESAVVIARDNKEGEKELVAYLSGHFEWADTYAAVLRTHLSRSLPSYMIPAHFVQLDAIPLTSNGKIDKKKLPAPESSGIKAGVTYIAPRNSVEEKLVAIWCELLERETVGVKDNFFDLGGHSLKITRLASRIHKAFDVKLQLKDLFTNTILEDQSQLIADAQQSSFASIEAVDIQEDYLLSASQRRLWIASQLEQGNQAYNIPAAYVFEGNLDYAALRSAFNELIQRHQSLRTIFHENAHGEVRQLILPVEKASLTIGFIDLRNETSQQQKVRSLVQSEFTFAFNLSQGPLLRTGIIQVEDAKWIFTCVMHHIITDGWSMSIFIKELMLLYNARVNEQTVSLSPLRIQYKDYAAWQNKQQDSDAVAVHKTWWLQQLEGELPMLQLPVDKARPAVKTYNGATISSTISTATCNKLRQLANENDATLFMGLLAAVNTLLYRYTGQEDIITGTQIAGRQHADLEDQMGMYLNTLPLRARFKGSDSFSDLLANIRQVTLGAYEHQDYPFDELVDALDLRRDVSRHQLFDVSVVLQTAALENMLEEQQLAGLRVTAYAEVENPIAKFDLAFDFVEQGEQIEARLVYNTDIYLSETARQLLAHFTQLLSAITESPATPVGLLDYLSDDEKIQLLKTFNDTKVPYPVDRSIVELFQDQVAEKPEHIALKFGEKQLTYASLEQQSNKLANYLRTAYEIQPDDCIGIMLDRSDKLIISILGVLKAGAAYVPVDPDYPKTRKEFMLKDTSVKVLITQTDYIFGLDYFQGEVFAVDVQLDSLNASAEAPIEINHPGDLAYVMYTSGSTGNPKGVMVEHGSVVRLVKSSNYVAFTGNEVILSTGAVSFDATTFEYWGALLNGGTLVLCSRETLLETQLLSAEICGKQVDTMWFTAGWLNQLVEKDISVFNGLKTIVAGGDKLSPYHINTLLKTYPSVTIVNGYGPTENTTFSLTFTLNREVENIPVGKPINNSTAFIVDANGQLCPIGVAGEIWVGGDGLARGYLNNPGLTAEKFVASPFAKDERLYKTGDLGRWLRNGNIEFIGRKDDQVKIRGFRIELGEIENALLTHPGVDAAAVVVKIKDDEKQIVAYVSGRSAQPDTWQAAATLREHLGKLLPSYMIPSYFVKLDELPLTSNGKVDRKNLPDPEELELTANTQYIAPRNTTEEKLVEIWQDVLGKQNISVTDNFFEIGGHSLKATRLASQIHKEFEVKIELKDLFNKTILEEQAQLIEQSLKTSFATITAIAHQSDYRMSSSQRRLWALSQLEEINLTYNIPVAYIFEGKLDTDALQQAFRMLIARHEILRTVFRENAAGEIRQVILDTGATGFNIDYTDVRNDQNTEQLLKELIQQEFALPFNLSAGPLLRAHLYQVADDKWAFSYVMHHIISDGWSMGILMKELLSFYTHPQSLPALRIQYKDYASWQQQQLSGSALAVHKNYWLQQFAGTLPVLQLPVDKERPASQSYNGAVVIKHIDASVANAVHELSRQQGGTLYMALLSAVNILLHRYTAQEDIIIGSPIANREHADLEGQIGFYLNTIALRTRFKATDTYKELFDNVKQVTLGAFAHQVYPFDELVDDLNLKRDLGRSALFDVMILLQNFNTGNSEFEQDFGEVSVRRYRGGEHVVSKYDLTFYFTETVEGIRADIEYNTDIFYRDTIVRMGDYLESILRATTERPLSTLNDLIIKSLGGGRLPLDLTNNNLLQAACSEHQKRLWFIDQFEKNYLYEGSPVYHNLPLIVKLSADITTDALNNAIVQVLQQHDILRTNIFSENSEPYQVVNNNSFNGIRLHDMEIADAEALLQIIEQPFDISKDALIRFDLIEQHNIFVITAHHLVADRQSLKIILEQILGHAQNIAERINNTLQYADFSQWQNQLNGSDLAPFDFYWKTKLENAPILYLETDHHREHIHIYNAAGFYQRLTPGISEKIALFCEQKGADASIFFLAVFEALLHRYTGSEEIVIGTLYNNRQDDVLTRMVGPLANLITIKNNIAGGVSFETLLKEVAAEYNSAVEFSAKPFEKVVLDINPGKDMSRTALFDVLFHYDEASPNTAYEEIELNRGVGKYDFNLLVKKDESFSLHLTFNEKYFKASRIERFLGYFNSIVEQVLNTPELSVNKLDIISAAEKHTLLQTFNDREVSYPDEKTIVDLFEEQVQRTPGNIAVVFEGQSFTYAELNEKSNRLANYLCANYNIQPDDLVGMKLERSLEMIIAIMAILKSGGAYVPIDPAYPQERIDYMIEDSRCKVVIDDEELAKFSAEENKYSSNNLIPVNKASDLAYVIYTSGTTGKPKGSLIEHRNVVRLFKTDKPLFDFKENDVWTMFHSYCFDFSVWEMYGALLFGGRVVVIPLLTAKDPAAYLEVLNREGVTVLNQTPSAFYNLIKEELEKQDATLKLRYVIFGGEALSPGKLAAFNKKYPSTELINMYGITETTVHVTYKKITSVEIENNSSNIGKPIPTLTCYVLDQYQQLCATGVPGELYVGGEGVCRGYLNREELTAKKFIENPFVKGERLYRSGDKATLLENGEMEYGGRLDDQVKVRGYRIELGEIENVFRRDGRIEDVVIIARPDEKGETNLIAYLVSKEKLNTAELRLELATQLPAYMLPSHYVQLDKLPLTSNGKINKKILPNPVDAVMETGAEYVAARNETEHRIVQIWQEILGRENISVKDNFFEIGGHSLKATRLASQLHKTFDVKVALKDLFTNVILEDQAQFILQSQRSSFEGIVALPLQTDYALSSSQRRLWVLSQFDEVNAAYNMPGVYLLEGSLNMQALEYSFNELVARHEILRTTFAANEKGEIRQRIHSANNTDFTVGYHDLRNEQTSNTLLKITVQKEIEKAFDLANGPLLRANLYHVADNKWVFTCVMHHIISDGWSLGVLVNELLVFYNTFVQNESMPLQPLRVHYKDYALWQQHQLHSDAMQQHKAYWLQQFAGELPVLELQGDKVRPAIKTYNGGVVHKIINEKVSTKIKAFTQHQGGTLFMALLAATNALLHRYTGQNDIIVGSPIAGRPHADLENQIGFYLNTLALRTKLSGENNFHELLDNTRQITLDAYEHQLYPFDELVDALALPRNLSRSPLFDVMVILQNTENYALNGEQHASGLKLSAYGESEQLITKFDLLFNFAEADEEIKLSLEYNSDIYNRSTIERLCNHFEQLLVAMLEQPHAALNKLDYLRADEIHHLLTVFNNTDTDFSDDKTLAELFEGQARVNADKVALVFKERSFTYKTLNELSNQLANYLKKQYKINADDLIAVQLERSEWMIISILAVLKSGGAYIPIDPEYPQDRIDYIKADSKCKLVIDENELQQFAKGKYSKRNPAAVSNAGSLAYVIYTSGSTGKPKGCMLEHRGVVNRIQWMWTHYGFNKTDIILQKTNYTFDVSVWEIFMPLCRGAKMVLCEREDVASPERIALLIEKQQITCLHFVPGMLNAFIGTLFTNREVQERLSSLRRVITSGEALTPGSVNSWYEKVETPLHNLYGPTEASVDVTYYPTAAGDEVIPIGRPIWNTQMYITGKAGELMPVGAVGEINIGGVGLARGYVNKAGLTQEKFVVNPFRKDAKMYRTGDLGRWLENGNIEFIGRKDDQVKIRGFRIELGEIENALQSSPAIDSAVVVTRVDKQGEKELVAYVVSKQVMNAAELRSWLGKTLPAYMIPAHFVQMTALPLTPNGKTDRKRLPDPEGFGLGSGAEYVAPTNETEEKLVHIWQQLLGKERIGIRDSFFDLGGHSLKALLLVSEIQKEFGVNVNVKEVFLHPTIETVSNVIRAGKWVENSKTPRRENRNIVEV
jgi:bacitracin synthase 3